MNNKKDILLIYILIIIEFIILFNSNIVINSVKNSLKLFITKIFPSLFPTMLIGNLLVKNNVHNIIPIKIKKIFNKILGFSDAMTSIFIISIFTGTPSNAVYINEYLNKGLINEEEAETLLCTTHFMNPLFVIGVVGTSVLKSTKLGFLLVFLLFFGNIIKANILRKYHKITFVKIDKILKNKSIIITLTESIKSSINALLLIMGIVIIFSLLISLICNIFNLNNNLNTFLNLILEITGGINKMSYFNIHPIIKFILSYYFLNFGGICIQTQTISMIQNKNIKFNKYFMFRIF